MPRPVAALVVSYLTEVVRPKLDLGEAAAAAYWWTSTAALDLTQVFRAATARANAAVIEMAA